MSVLNRRNRLVSFRVSEEEFQLFTALCQAQGARSISDLARVALQRLAQDRKERDDAFFERLEQMVTSVLDELRYTVERMNGTQEAEAGNDHGRASSKHYLPEVHFDAKKSD